MSKAPPDSPPLRLLATDPEDLTVIAAALQDAVGRIGDIVYEPFGRRLTMSVNRFRWEQKGSERVRTGLQINSVLSAQARKLRRGVKDAVVELLAIAFEPAEAPAGVLTLTFAGGGDLRCQVECVDAVLADVSAPWPAKHKPKH